MAANDDLGDKKLLKMWIPVLINSVMSVITYNVTVRLIPKLKDMFLKANLFGIDKSKTTSEKVPESLGVVTGCTFLITMFLFIPLSFGNETQNRDFPHDFVELIAALLSICCMLLLGFADDVLDLRWRHKLLLPTIASLPILMVYYVNFNGTTIVIPTPLRGFLGSSFIDIGLLYYIYMGMLAVFCTNAINILAGINGLEVGQSIVIAISIVIFNIIEMSSSTWKAHRFSLYFMLPYIASSLALLKFNWYPSSVFVGDTFCYFSGMTFAVVGILGHFSKTTLLFFMPQIFNFLYSIPQIFHLIDCPRHRLPKFNSKTDKLEISLTKFYYSKLNFLGKIVINLFRFFKLIQWHEKDDYVITNNFTLINLVLLYCGPLHEAKLTGILIVIQIFCTLLAFVIRYPLASYFYG